MFGHDEHCYIWRNQGNSKTCVKSHVHFVRWMTSRGKCSLWKYWRPIIIGKEREICSLELQEQRFISFLTKTFPKSSVIEPLGCSSGSLNAASLGVCNQQIKGKWTELIYCFSNNFNHLKRFTLESLSPNRTHIYPPIRRSVGNLGLSG